MKQFLLIWGFVTVISSCSKTENASTSVTPVANIEDNIKFTTNLDTSFPDVIDTLNITINTTSKLPSSGLIYSIFVKLVDSNKTVFKIDTNLNQANLSIKIPGLNLAGNYSVAIAVTSKSTSTNTLSKNFSYSQSMQFNVSQIDLSKSTQKDDLWKGWNMAVNGSVDFIDVNGVENMFLTPSFPRDPAPITHVPSVQLVKNNNKWIITNYYNNVTMGMGGRDVEKFGNDGYTWADTGEEPSNVDPANFPYGNVWVATNISNGTAKWTKVNQDLSFYHSVFSGDLNHDGKNDIVAIHMGTRGTVSDRIHTFINDGSNNFKQQIVIVPTAATGCAYREQAGNLEAGGCPSWSAGSIIMGDVNGDGYPEIIKGDHTHFSGDIIQHSIEVYTDSNKDGRYKRLDFHPLMGKWLEGYGAARLKLYDYDKDGDLDLFVKFENEQINSAALQIFNNDGHGIFTGPNYTIDLPSSKFMPAEFDLIDVDNDGDMDIVFNSQKNLNAADALMYGFGGDGTPNFNNSATINFDQLIYLNNGGSYSQCTKGFKKTIPSGSGIVWIKGMKVNNQFKFVCLQKTGNYIRSDANWDPNTWKTTIIEVYPKF